MLKKLVIIAGAVVLLAAAALAFWGIQENARVAAQVDAAWQSARVEPLPGLGSTRSLQILPLFEEAAARDDLEPEHGVSYLVRTDHANILLDVGMTPARLSHNMRSLGLSEKDIDIVFVSHLHPDHIGGVAAWQANTLIAGDPPLALRGKTAYVPLALTHPDLNVTVVTKPARLAEGVASIGPIAFADNLFPPSPVARYNVEQALAVNVEGKGIVLLTGCGHQSVEKMVARAQALFDAPVVGIVGGLHYDGMPPEQFQSNLAFVTGLQPLLVAVSPHDSGPDALAAFRAALPAAYQPVQVGRSITLTGGPQQPCDWPASVKPVCRVSVP